MRRQYPLAAVAAFLLVIGVGCSHASTETSPDAVVTGAVTDGGDTGLKPVAGQTVAGKPDAAHGSEIFKQNCVGCHGAGGAGGAGMIGPRLVGEKKRKDMAAAVAWIKNPVAPMPKLYPSPLNERDVNDVAAYVESL